MSAKLTTRLQYTAPETAATFPTRQDPDSGNNDAVKRRSHPLGQLFWIEGLRKKRQIAGWGVQGYLGQITGGKQNLRRWAVGSRPVGEVASTHIGQHNIADDKVDDIALDQAFGFIGAK